MGLSFIGTFTTVYNKHIDIYLDRQNGCVRLLVRTGIKSIRLLVQLGSDRIPGRNRLLRDQTVFKWLGMKLSGCVRLLVRTGPDRYWNGPK
jgi:hypothetical protein